MDCFSSEDESKRYSVQKRACLVFTPLRPGLSGGGIDRLAPLLETDMDLPADSRISQQAPPANPETGVGGWVSRHVWKPLAAGALHEPAAAISAATGLADEQELRDGLRANRVPAQSTTEALTQSFAHGLGTVVPYGIAIVLARTPLKALSGRLGQQLWLGRALGAQGTAFISGATAYDIFRIPEGNQTRLSNGAEGLLTFSMLYGGNRLVPAQSMRGRLLGFAGIGALAGVGQDVLHGALTKDESTPSSLLRSGATTAALNMVLPPLLLKGPGSRTLNSVESAGEPRKMLEIGDILNQAESGKNGIGKHIDDFISSLPARAHEIGDGFSAGAGRSRAGSPLVQRQEELLKFVERDRQQFGDGSPYRIANLLELGKSHLKESSDPIAARRYYDESLRLLERNPHSTVVDHGRAYLDIGRFYQEVGQDKIAAYSFEKALGYRVNNYSPDDLALMRNLADSYTKTADKSKAADLIRRRIAESQRIWGVSGESHGEVLRDSARLMERLGERETAAQLNRHAQLIDSIAVMERSVGREHPLLVRDLNMLSEVLEVSKMPLESALLKERAEMILLLKKTRGPDYQSLPDDLRTLAAYYRRSNDSGDAAGAHRLENKAEAIIARRKPQ